MKIGAAYYPEHVDEEQWNPDLRTMTEAGITRVRIAEFAWSRLEPDEGRFAWEWLDRFIGLAAGYGIEAALCTPTAAPPVWLAEKHPEIMPVNEEGRRLVFGKRQHRCYNTPAYVDYSLRIVEAMGKRYGSHPNVVAWQLDNEFGGEQKYCYCDNCAERFRAFLREKYADMGELNERWGNAFWSHDYQRFDQIALPLRIDAQLWLKHSPSLELEFMRFSSQSIVEYCRKQTALLRRYTDRIITTNTDPFFYGDNVDLVQLFRDLDIGAIDVYSTELYEIAFYSDIVRSLKNGRFWMTEYGVYSDNLPVEMEQLEQMGCEYLNFFKFRPFPFGQEQGDNGLLTMTGAPGKNYAALMEWSGRTGAMNAAGLTVGSSRIGIHYDFESSWALTQSVWGTQTSRWRYPLYMLHTVYKSFFEEKLPVRFVYDKKRDDDLDWLILPRHILYDPVLECALIQFVRKGGKLVVTTDLFRKNRDNVYLTEVPPIYREIPGPSADDFFYPNAHGTGIILSAAVGSGRVWVLHEDTDEAGWKAFIREKIAFSAET